MKRAEINQKTMIHQMSTDALFERWCELGQAYQEIKAEGGSPYLDEMVREGDLILREAERRLQGWKTKSYPCAICKKQMPYSEWPEPFCDDCFPNPSDDQIPF